MQAAQKAISTPARSTQPVCCFVPHPNRPPPSHTHTHTHTHTCLQVSHKPVHARPRQRLPATVLLCTAPPPTPTLASRSLTKPSMPARVSASQMDASEAACWKGSRLLRTVPLKMTGSCNVWTFVRGG